MKRNTSKQRREKRVRQKVQGTKECPRLSVFRSNASIYAQLIDDEEGMTLIGVTDRMLEKQEEKKGKTNQARAIGMLLAKKAAEKNITKVVFDRGSYAYHGRVKALAEGAREGGLLF